MLNSKSDLPRSPRPQCQGLTTTDRRKRTLASLFALATLAACGGGGDNSTNTAPPPAPAPAPAPAPSLTLGGTAATGAPIAGQAVSVRCATGTASGVTGTDGSYSVAIPSGAWPCLAQVTSSSGTVLTTVATASGTSAIAHITPATQLILATLLAGDPSAYFQSFGNAQAATFTTATVATAQARVISVLAAAGVDFSAAGNLLAGPYTQTYDIALMALGTRLAASGTTLPALTATFAAAAAPSAVSVASELLLQPAAANCGALRTAIYRVLTPVNGGTLAAQSGLMALNAATLAVTHPDGRTGTWVANGACRFSEQTGNYNADITVSPAGVLLGRYTADGVSYRTFVGFPEQTHALAELAGNWNAIGMSRVSSSTYVANAGSISYDGAGTVTAASNCQNNATWAIDVCTALTGTLLTGIVPVAVDGAGGFDLTDPNTRTVTGRLFAFKAGSGDLMQASVGTKGELFFFAPAITGVPPAVGFASARWDLDSLASFLSASTIYATGSTVTAVDTTAGSWTRTQTTVGSATTHPETLYANTPRAGYVYRPAATVTDSSGAQITVNTFTSQSMPGMGFSPLILVTASGTKLFELSGRQP